MIVCLKTINGGNFLQPWKLGRCLYTFSDSSWYVFLWPSSLSCSLWLSSLMETFWKRVGINKICMFVFPLLMTVGKHHLLLSVVCCDELALRRMTWCILGASLSFLPSPTFGAGTVGFHSAVSSCCLSAEGAGSTNPGSQLVLDTTLLSESGSLNYSFSFLILLFRSNSCCVFGASCQSWA